MYYFVTPQSRLEEYATMCKQSNFYTFTSDSPVVIFFRQAGVIIFGNERPEAFYCYRVYLFQAIRF
jgi:rhamnose utilization protein RhaD (predicted bifunctional aldolase and dehydrogenase)